MLSSFHIEVRDSKNGRCLLYPFVAPMSSLLKSPMEALFEEYPKVLFSFCDSFLESFYMYSDNRLRACYIFGNRSLYCDAHNLMGAYYV